MTARALLVAALLSGCTLWGGGVADDVMCGAAPPGAPQQLRDPQSGTCESFGDGCRGIPLPDWAVCDGACEQLAEGPCLVTAGCRAVYTNACPPGQVCPPDSLYDFLGCWGTAPASTVEGGGCDGLDAFGCSQHDDCAAVYDQYETTDPLAQLLSFSSCIAEPALAGGR